MAPTGLILVEAGWWSRTMTLSVEVMASGVTAQILMSKKFWGMISRKQKKDILRIKKGIVNQRKKKSCAGLISHQKCLPALYSKGPWEMRNNNCVLKLKHILFDCCCNLAEDQVIFDGKKQTNKQLIPRDSQTFSCLCGSALIQKMYPIPHKKHHPLTREITDTTA